MRPLVARILASFLRLVADAFSPHPVETISRPFSAALGRQSRSPLSVVRASLTARSAATIFGSWRLQATSAILQGNNRASRAEHACTRLPSQGWNRKGRTIGLTRTPARLADPASRG